MKLDPNDLKRHYASLSDEGLLEINRDDLVEIAQKIYDAEIASRGLTLTAKEEPEDEPEYDAKPVIKTDDEPAWLGDAVCVYHCDTGGPAPDANAVRTAIEHAGIPCFIATFRKDDHGTGPRLEYDVLVPGVLALHATSIVDRDVLNGIEEENWRNHLAQLSDEEFAALDPRVFCAGFLDKAARLKRAYEDEIKRRQTDA